MADPQIAPARPRRPGLLLTRLAFAQLIISIDYNIVYVALPEIGRQLGFSGHTLQWVISAYAVAFGGFLLLGGRACDLFGPTSGVRCRPHPVRRLLAGRWARAP